MDRKTLTIIIVGCIITFLIVPIATLLIVEHFSKQPASNNGNSSQTSSNNNTIPSNRSNDEITAVIVAKHPELSSDNGPIFVIMNVTKPALGWYVVKVRMQDDAEGTNSARILLQDTPQKGLQMLLGPGTSFPDDVTQPLGIPTVVSQELNAS